MNRGHAADGLASAQTVTPAAAAAAPASLRARLLWFLLGAIVLAALVQGTLAYRAALAQADDIFDYHMQQMALALRAGLPPPAVSPGSPLALDDGADDFIVQVWSVDGLRVYGSSPRVLLPRRVVPGFSDLRTPRGTYRVFSLRTPQQVIQVAQDMAPRRAMAGRLALRSTAPVAVMAPLLMLVVWGVVSVSLAPVARVRRQVAARQADDLTPLSDAALPAEVRPLVQELNLLFGRMRQAFDAQQRFVADAAHELRSPLAALSLQVQGLQRAADAATRDVAVARLAAGVERATRLVEQLLVLARQQASIAGASPPVPVVLADLARQAVADAAAAAQARGIDVGWHAGDGDGDGGAVADAGAGAGGEADRNADVAFGDVPPSTGASPAGAGSQARTGDDRAHTAEAAALVIDGHPDALRVLLRNLLDNAVKYTPRGGRVDVAVARARGSGGVLLSVDDSGPGIPAADRARVLDRFYRVAGSDAVGSGLGLAIVKAIADLHGAALALEPSPRLGGLRVTLQFAQRPQQAAPTG